MLKIVRLLAVTAAVMALAAAPAAAGTNIVVIMTDDQDDMGSLDAMPYVQRMMIERGTRFINSFVDTSICCPSRATLMTGQSAVNHGVRTNSAPEGGYAAFAPREHNALGVWLQQAGYVTALMGKVLNEYGDDDPAHVMPGWNEWHGLLAPAQAYFGNTFNENGVIVEYGPTDYVTDVIEDKAVGFIEGREGLLQPFFLLVTPPAPHDAKSGPPKPAPRHDGTLAGIPFPAPPNFNEADVSDKPSFIRNRAPLDEAEIAATSLKHRKRAESLLAVDEMVRAIIGALRRIDALENTVIVFTSDNGFSLGSHRWERKYLPYEESIRVPLIMRGTGIPENEIREQLVSNMDLSATIMDLAGVLPGNALDGRSLLQVLANPGLPWRTVIGIHGFDDGKTFMASRTAQFMFAQYETGAGIEEEFYDLATDPDQMSNAIADPQYADVLAFMRDASATLAGCSGQSCFITDVPPMPGG